MPKRQSPVLDMTPMVDLAFLLVTFFMLTTKFSATEPVTVTEPRSHSDKLLPTNVMMVTVDSAGRVFYNIEGQEVRKNVLARMGEKYEIQFTEEEAKRFAVMLSYGAPVQDLKKYISYGETERAVFDKQTKGIPVDSLNNQLSDWINFGRHEAARDYQAKIDEGKNPNKLRVAIKGDGNAEYADVKHVMDIFQDMKVNQFNLITNQEQEAVALE